MQRSDKGALGRRDFVTRMGLGAGAALLTPSVRGLVAEAQGQTAAKRVLIYVSEWGYLEQHLLPKVRTPTDFDLAPTMKPLEPYKADLVLATNMFIAAAGDQHGYWGSLLKAGGAGQTFDRFLASKLGQEDRFSSLYVQPGKMAPGGVAIESYDGAQRPYPPMISPVEAYQKIFVDTASGGGADATKLLRQDRSALDFVTADIGRLNARLAGAEKEKLERYLESIRALEKKTLAPALAPGKCAAPPAPAAALATIKGMNEIAALEAYVDLTATALACGLSRVGLVYGGNYDYRAIGARTDNLHDLTHALDAILPKVYEWRMSQVARAVARFRALGLGESSLVLFSDGGGTIHHGGGRKLFAILVGRLGGALKTGRTFTFPTVARSPKEPLSPGDVPAGAQSLGALFVSVANAVGAATTTFGDARYTQGPLPGLSA